jgi:hypothetical protein
MISVQVAGRLSTPDPANTTLCLHFPELTVDLFYPPEKLHLDPSGNYAVSAQVDTDNPKSQLWVIARGSNATFAECRDLLVEGDSVRCAVPLLTLSRPLEAPSSSATANPPMSAAARRTREVPANQQDVLQFFRHHSKMLYQ